MNSLLRVVISALAIAAAAVAQDVTCDALIPGCTGDTAVSVPVSSVDGTVSAPEPALTSTTSTDDGAATNTAVSGPALTASPSLQSVSGCAAVVSTTDICSTCFTADCVILATITVNTNCGCPATPATIYSSHPCALGCGGLGCGTAYTVVTATGIEGCGVTAIGPNPTQATTTGGGPNNTTLVTPTKPPATAVISSAGAGRLTPFNLW
ncbi:hypothetical protein B0T24DRAFT_612568 [Lasiosphaeria ovina]|uniref:Uncharacterized protein n=1 Tax=Lasiosphaeria ovina TaxID=92902 RepID=A0AAE0TSH6_9PEZI|nr:hypothetical protein B0T24DRAFT_612568 [Lasiosphaeria ovina]